MEYVKCDLCGSGDVALLFTAKDINQLKKGLFNIVKCRKCGLVYVNPRPTKQEISKFYPKSYFLGTNFKTTLKSDVSQSQFSKIEKIKKPGKILDIGCGSGEFLAIARQNNWEVYGVEISKIATKYAKEKFGMNVFTGELLETNYPNEYFDVVTMWQVLEHLPNPSEVLTEINRILKNDGLLVVAVPNINSYQARIFKEFWFHLDAPRHLYHFEPDTLKKMLRKNGFKVLKINHFSNEHNASGLIFSILTMIRSKKYTSERMKKVIKDSQYTLFAKRFLYPLIKYGATIFSYLTSILGYGATIETYCIKIKN